MANLFSALPVPAGNGSGAAVDVSAFGAPKTVVVVGDIVATINIEVSVSGAAGPWAGVASFGRGGANGMQEAKLPVAAQFMRATVSGFVRGSAVAAVGADDAGASVVNLPTTAGNGTGASVDVSALGSLNTFVVSGTWTGSITIEVSQDGVNFADLISFGPTDTGPVAKTVAFVGQFLRVRRTDASPSLPGTVIVNVGAVADAGGGGGGGAGGLGLVFQPGGGGSGPVFFDAWADLMTELASLRTAAGGNLPIDIFFDGGTMTIPAGVYEMENVTWRSHRGINGQTPVVELDPGATVPNLLRFVGPIEVRWDGGAAAAPVELDDEDCIHLVDAEIRGAGGAGSTPFFDGTGLDHNEDVSVILERSTFDASLADHVLETSVNLVDVFLYFDNASLVDDDALTVPQFAEVRGQWLGDFRPQANVDTFRPGGMNENQGQTWRLTETAASPVNLTDEDFNQIVAVDASGGAIAVNLPACGGYNEGKSMVVKSSTSTLGGNITINPAGADTIDGSASFVISTPLASITLVSDGASNWHVI